MWIRFDMTNLSIVIIEMEVSYPFHNDIIQIETQHLSLIAVV